MLDSDSIVVAEEGSMDFDEIVSPEVGAAAAATAIVLSSRTRRWLREGAVYGLAGMLTAGDALLSFGRGVGRGFRLRAGNGTSAQNGDGALPQAIAESSANGPSTEGPAQ
jgi:hypothetical protein